METLTRENCPTSQRANLMADPKIQAAAALSSIMASETGKVDISPDKPISINLRPESTTYVIDNPNNEKSANVVAYVFNEAYLKNTLTDNTFDPLAVSADKPSISYGDGAFSGKLVQRYIERLSQIGGLHCKELTVIAEDATNAQSDAAILNMNASLQSYNIVRGSEVPVNIDLGQALRASAFKDGMVTVKTDFYVNELTQLSFDCPKGYKYTLKFKWA